MTLPVNAHRDAAMADVPFLTVLAGCSARRPERSVAGHISEGQRRNAPVSAVENGILAVSASLSAAPNFTANLEEVRAFFLAQDAATAPARFSKLKSELREMKTILSWSPAGGRPARFLNGHSAQARLRTASVLQLATQAGLPYLREYVVAQHVVLYAHSDAEVVLLALKHHRQLAYSAIQ